MRQSIAIGIAVVVLTSVVMMPVQGQTVSGGTTEISCNGSQATVDIETAVSLFEANTDQIPDVIKPALASNTTHLHIEGAATADYTVTTDADFTVTGIEIGEPADPDVVVETNRNTACEITTADDPVESFQTAYANDRIEITSTGVVGGTATYVVDRVVDAVQTIGELAG
ncbi:hypothetical protein [Halohasta litorea]|uniref:Uncharacterized protein n=1 Tax=Halohasta litorea TaxID=869891 RepID=A0ABD6DA38_9EURY|nr:hypothetical protein [Halohasta litorea]MEA1931993.1 hypothetical protein [Euryarchaeota archaeon]